MEASAAATAARRSKRKLRKKRSTGARRVPEWQALPLATWVHAHLRWAEVSRLGKRVPEALLTAGAAQMSITCRSSGKPTRQVVPSPGSMVAVRWLTRTITPTTVFRCLSSKATFSPQRKSLRLARGAGVGAGWLAGRGAPGATGCTAV